ncbi:CD63 antigen [Alligator mississippiensis]|uniref:Tetraspanin n=1 Tax=Alligator mississippiensis TaxID=8496 RepID=A0A151NL05_ALLMI|nr:CD63 antigen [Alligator mississippiensis]KYO37491.1 CD63 antigen [Alligator mississippiensis]
MALESGMKCVKCLVFFFNLLFWVCGIALVGLGIYVQVMLNKSLTMHNLSASGPAIVIIAVGVVIFFISFFGCCGAWKESYCMVTTFAVLLTLIFLVEIAAAIAGYVFKDKLRKTLEDELWREMHNYTNDKLAKEAMDELQKQYMCCGANNYTDWETIPGFKENRTVPLSCCRTNATAKCNEHPTSATIYTEGCLKTMEAWMKKHIVVVAAVALGIAFFEILGIAFACCLMKGIRSGYEVM